MNNKLLIIISTAEPDKAATGLMYAVNALLHGWMDDVKLFIFGPAESIILQHDQLQERLEQFRDMGHKATACKYLADEKGIASEIDALGVHVDYVGESISGLIREGYIPMVW